jgi:hypothetical protein
MPHTAPEVGYSGRNRPPPKPLHDAQMGGASFFPGYRVKPSLSWDEQVALLVKRGLAVDDLAACASFLAATNYYRFSGYARYFQHAPHRGHDDFRDGTAFDEVRTIYEADEALRAVLVQQLARVEVLLRAQTAYVIANEHGPRGRHLQADFYTDAGSQEPTVEACLRDIVRSKERYILRYKNSTGSASDYSDLPCGRPSRRGRSARFPSASSAARRALWLEPSQRVSVLRTRASPTASGRWSTSATVVLITAACGTTPSSTPGPLPTTCGSRPRSWPGSSSIARCWTSSRRLTTCWCAARPPIPFSRSS